MGVLGLLPDLLGRRSWIAWGLGVGSLVRGRLGMCGRALRRVVR